MGDLRAVDTKQNAPGKGGAGTAGKPIDYTPIVPPRESFVKRDEIPTALLSRKVWVCWRLETNKDGKLTKVPYSPATGKNAKSNDASTWGSLDTALSHVGAYDGIGTMTGDGLTGIDLDDCRNPETEELTDWASSIVKEMDTYTEISPSGTGLHLLLFGTKPDLLDRCRIPYGEGGKIEVYDKKQYLTFTGNHLADTSFEIEERQDQLNIFCNKYFPVTETEAPTPPPATATDLTDADLLEKAFNAKNGDKVQQLFVQGIGDPDTSRKDASLAWCLSYWTGNDPARLERLMRQSALLRPKWDEPRGNSTWIQNECLQAIAKRTEFYTPGRQHPQEPRCAPEQAADTKTTQAEILYALAQKAVFFRDSGVTRYATVPAGDTYELCERGGGFRDWLLRMYRAEHHRSPSTTALQQAMDSIVAEAAVAPIYTVGLRVAATDDALWVDLANDPCEVAKVTASGWTITAELPDGLRFRRPRGQVALPTPTHNGDGFGLLRKLLSNATDDDFIMIVAWLMAALRPNVPAPVLVLTGEQGSAKTTTAKILRYLIDPVGADGTDLTRPPNNDRDIFAIVNSLHVLAIDNVSRITKFVSDTLSSISTGGSLQKRELYKDEGMVNISARRPIIINGIGGGAADIASRPDLLDRAISVTLQSIEDTERKTEADIWRDVRDAAPAILGALLNGMSEALLRMPTTKLDRLPRMADFALWIVSAENVLPWDAGQFMQIYAANRDEATANMLEDNLIFPYVATLAAGDGGWSGTNVELHSALQQMASEQSKRAEDWPDTPRKVAKHMKRIEPAMKQAGYEIQRDRTKAARLITVKKVTLGD